MFIVCWGFTVYCLSSIQLTRISDRQGQAECKKIVPLPYFLTLDGLVWLEVNFLMDSSFWSETWPGNSMCRTTSKHWVVGQQLMLNFGSGFFSLFVQNEVLHAKSHDLKRGFKHCPDHEIIFEIIMYCSPWLGVWNVRPWEINVHALPVRSWEPMQLINLAWPGKIGKQVECLDRLYTHPLESSNN